MALAVNESSVFPCPEWVKSAVFYQIFPDRFAKSADYVPAGNFCKWGAAPTVQGMCGGNLRGIIEKLDYIRDLGANALYLCPIFKSASNHRYHTVDYMQIDPVLGTMADFDELVREVHARKMHIILDGVFNHCSRGFFPFVSVMEQGADSPYKDWFHIDSFPVNAYSGKLNYRCWWNLHALPKFNTDNSEVRGYIMNVAEYWIRRGADGWRLDVPNEIDDDPFWREFRTRVKTVNPDAYIVGEIWEDPSRWLQGDQFDGVMNYPARRLILNFFFPAGMKRFTRSTGEPESAARSNALTADAFCQGLQESFAHKYFGVPFNLLGSHDTPRLATIGEGRPEDEFLALALFLFMPGAHSIYYGDEIGLGGGRDPDNRRCFPWGSFDAGEEPQPFALLRKFIRILLKEPVWVSGDFSIRPEGQGILACRRKGADMLELRIAYPGPVPLPGISARTDVLFALKKEPIQGVAGYFVAKGGATLTKKRAT